MTAKLATLDCEDCGRVLRVLQPHEAQIVAEQPYRFVVWCEPCGTARVEEEGL